MKRLLVTMLLLLPLQAQAATYYVGPSGNDANDGSAGAPWQSLIWAVNVSRAWCGDLLLLKDGTQASLLDVSFVTCTIGNELTIRAENQRQAKLQDPGTGRAAKVSQSSYITLDGLYAASTDNSGGTIGEPFAVLNSDHITIRNSVASNPNRYFNDHAIDIQNSTNILVEDTEVYIFHRHCILGWQSEQVVARRVYCNPRGGKIAGGFSSGGLPLGSGDSVISMYPCLNCIGENLIADGTTHPMYLSEMNATFGSGVLMSGSQVLGSICYKCNVGNGIYPNARTSADVNHTPQNGTVKDNVWVDFASTGLTLRCADCVNFLVDHNSTFGLSGGGGFHAQDSAFGGTSATNSIVLTNNLATGMSAAGFSVATAGYGSWSGNTNRSTGNTTSFSPAPPSNWGTTYTDAHGMGTCKLWVPVGAAGKGQGTGGSDIGATILYRYQDGVLTAIPLWNQTTGEFPYGAATADGINRVAGQSLFDFHTRVNVNTGGCSFPTDYGTSGGVTPSTVVMGTYATSGSGTTSLSWDHTIASNQDQELVCVGLYDGGGNVGSVATADLSGQTMSLVKRSVTSPAYRASELWSVASPTSGLRTITLTTTGSVTAMLGRAIEFDATSGLNTAGANNGFGTSVNVTVSTNTNELIVDCVASNKSFTFSAGTDQTFVSLPQSHTTQSLSLGVTTQPGSAGGVMDETLGGSVYWPTAAVSLIAGTPDTPLTATLTLSRYQIISTYGTESGAASLSAINTAATISTGGEFRIRAEITAGVATSSSFGAALYCQKNGGGYTRTSNSTGAHGIRLYGAGLVSDLPTHLTATTQRFTPSGSFTTGALIRDDSSTFVVPAMASGNKTELEFVGAATLAVGDTVTCQVRKDDGSQLDVYTVTPTLTAVAPSASFGF